jgi:tetratricopeptide (TPR) repeat protein
MSIQNVLRTFRSSISPARRTPVPLDEEVGLYRRRAEMALEEERFQDALVFLAKILRLNPYDLSARMIVAQSYHYGLLEVEKAVMAYEKVVATAGYDDSNPYCAAARAAIRELSAPAADGAEAEIGISRIDLAGVESEENGPVPQTAAV